MAAAAVLVLVAGCGSDEGAPPRPVPVELVPPSLRSGTVTLTEFTGAAEAFAKAGDLSLVDRGTLFELRRADSLIGTLELATLKPKVNLASKPVQDQIRNQAVTGQRVAITVEGVPVTVSKSADKIAYFWFGPGMFELLIVKDPNGESEQMLVELMRHQRANGLGDVVLEGETTTTRRTRQR